MTRRLLLLAALFAASRVDPALAERLILSLSSNEVAIGSNYTGSRLVAFGMIERDGQNVPRDGPFDIVVTVLGPREGIVVRRKELLGPIWLNRSQQKFVQIPSFLGVFSSRPVGEIMDGAMRRKLRIGVDAIVNAPEFTIDRGGDDDPFRAALSRLKTRDSLYVENPRGVTFVSEGFFRAAIPLPAVAPVGSYEVEASLIANGVVVARRQANFELVKTGLEEQLTELARERPFLLGLGTAGMSLMFGWLASVIFRRD